MKKSVVWFTMGAGTGDAGVVLRGTRNSPTPERERGREGSQTFTVASHTTYLDSYLYCNSSTPAMLQHKPRKVSARRHSPFRGGSSTVQTRESRVQTTRRRLSVSSKAADGRHNRRHLQRNTGVAPAAAACSPSPSSMEPGPGAAAFRNKQLGSQGRTGAPPVFPMR